MEIIDFGITSYRTIWEKQKSLQEKLVGLKKDKYSINDEVVMIGEHSPVYTLGFHGDAANLLIDENSLKSKGCECIRIERGGDITFHGPGQLILYPIIDLEKRGLGVKKYINILEESVIRVLNDYGIKGERVEGATGVWIDSATPHERKICAIGVKISRSITMHGLALNVNTDLSWFSAINPCGFIDKGVTSIRKEIGIEVDMNEVKDKILNIFLSMIDCVKEK